MKDQSLVKHKVSTYTKIQPQKLQWVDDLKNFLKMKMNKFLIFEVPFTTHLDPTKAILAHKNGH